MPPNLTQRNVSVASFRAGALCSTILTLYCWPAPVVVVADLYTCVKLEPGSTGLTNQLAVADVRSVLYVFIIYLFPNIDIDSMRW